MTKKIIGLLLLMLKPAFSGLIDPTESPGNFIRNNNNGVPCYENPEYVQALLEPISAINKIPYRTVKNISDYKYLREQDPFCILEKNGLQTAGCYGCVGLALWNEEEKIVGLKHILCDNEGKDLKKDWNHPEKTKAYCVANCHIFVPKDSQETFMPQVVKGLKELGIHVRGIDCPKVISVPTDSGPLFVVNDTLDLDAMHEEGQSIAVDPQLGPVCQKSIQD